MRIPLSLLLVSVFFLVACDPQTVTGPSSQGKGAPVTVNIVAAPSIQLPTPYRQLTSPGMGYFPMPSGYDVQTWSIGVKYSSTAIQPQYTRLYEAGGYHQVGGMDIELSSGASQDRVSCVMFNELTSIDQTVTARVDSLSAAPLSASVLCTYDGSTLRMYLNGVLQGSASGAYNTPSWNEGIGEASSGGFTFSGSISDVSYWQKALIQSEISLY